MKRLIPSFSCAVLFLAASVASASTQPVPKFKKVMMVVLENTDYAQAIQQPFLAKLASLGANLTNFYAETHPSQPNYIAMVSGSTHGVKSDSPVNLNVKHIGDLLEAKQKTWKAYVEQFPGNCFQGATSGIYARKHVPFISFTNVSKSAARCGNVVDASELDQDMQNGTLPDYSFYTPNMNDDGHDTGAANADQWLSDNFGTRLQDPKFMQDLLFIVTFDEGTTFGSNQIYTVLYGDSVVPGSVASARYDHYSLLRTIEDTLGLGNLGQSDATAAAVTGIWK